MRKSFKEEGEEAKPWVSRVRGQGLASANAEEGVCLVNQGLARSQYRWNGDIEVKSETESLIRVS